MQVMSWDDGEHAKVKKVNDAPAPSGSGPEKVGPKGGEGGTAWDDGFDHDGVTSIYVSHGMGGISSVQFDYAKGGRTEHGALHGREALIETIGIDHPDEYLVSVEGWYYFSNITNCLYDSIKIIKGIQFKTNKKTSPYICDKFYGIGMQFTLQVQDKKIIGFFGCSSSHLNSIGAYFVPNGPGPERVGPKGGEGGTAWDDGYDHDGVTKIYVGFSKHGIHSVKFDYVKGALHGEHGIESTTEFGINHPGEYLLSVEGWYDSTNIIQGIKFRTNLKPSLYIGYKPDGTGTEFTLKVQDKKIIGFFGFSNDYLHSIGAYFVPTGPKPEKMGPKGGEGGTAWDDGYDHDGMTKIYVGFAKHGIHSVKFDYVNGVLHGENGIESTTEFGINHPEEYLLSVEGWYDSTNIIQGIKFRTNLKPSPYIGYEPDGTGTEFTLQVQDKKIIGFFGFSSNYLNSIGAYFVLSGHQTQ